MVELLAGVVVKALLKGIVELGLAAAAPQAEQDLLRRTDRDRRVNQREDRVERRLRIPRRRGRCRRLHLYDLFAQADADLLCRSPRRLHRSSHGRLSAERGADRAFQLHLCTEIFPAEGDRGLIPRVTADDEIFICLLLRNQISQKCNQLEIQRILAGARKTDPLRHNVCRHHFIHDLKGQRIGSLTVKQDDPVVRRDLPDAKQSG